MYNTTITPITSGKHSYDCELGHLIFYSGNILNRKCPIYIIALLRDVERTLTNIMPNNYDDPFSNSGNVDGFNNGVFEVHAFDWNEDNNQKYNFKWKNIEISWYKYLGRDTMMNMDISEKQAISMYNDCMKSLLGDK